MARFFCAFSLLLLSLSSQAQLPLVARLVRQPASRDTGLPTPTGHAVQANVPWVVYSDRDDNPTYREPNLAIKFKQLRFREACYVLAERAGFLRLMQYDPALKVGTFYSHRLLKSRKAAKYIGWVPKNRLLLTSQAPRDSAHTLPTLYCPALASSRVLLGSEQFLRHDSLRLFGRPDLIGQLPQRLKLYDLAYVYKFSESGQEALLGTADWFAADSAAKFLLGWAPTTALQPVGQGWFLEPDTIHRARASYRLYESPTSAWQQISDSLMRAQAFSAVPWSSQGPRLPVLQRYQQALHPVVEQLGMLMPLLAMRPVVSNSVLNVNGHRLTRQEAAHWHNRSRMYNVVYVLEDTPAMQHYWGEVVSAVQATTEQLQDATHREIYRLGAVTYHRVAFSNSASLLPLPLTTHFAQLIDKLAHSTGAKQPKSGQGQSFRQPIREGLERAFRMLRDHQGENNLVVLVGISGDGHGNIARMKAIVEGLQAAEARLLAFQLAAPPDTVANNFVLQAQQLVMQSAQAVGTAKRKRLVSPQLVVPKPVYTHGSTQNSYHLDFPRRSMVPGWVLFPPKGHELPVSLLLAATDSILAQLHFDVQQTQASVDQTFANALRLRSHLNPQINRTLLARREAPAPELPAALLTLRAYPFYCQTYVPISQADTTFRHLRLLTPDAYAVLGQWLDLLAADALNPVHPRDRNELMGYFRQLRERVAPTLPDTATLAQPLSQLFGLPVRHPLLTQLRFSDLATPSVMSPAVWARLLYLMRERRGYYQRVPTFANSRFTSNGRTYYWLSEDLFR